MDTVGKKFCVEIVRKVWWWLLVVILLKVRFEWLVFHGGMVDDLYMFSRNLFYVGAILFCILMTCIFVSARRFKSALVYALICLIRFLLLIQSETLTGIDLSIKGRLFSVFPSLCPSPINANEAGVCYRYEVEVTGGEHETLVIDPGDELSRPHQNWPAKVRKIFSPDGIAEVSECEIENTKRIVDHVYRVSGNCWNL